jgi:two-component system, chemotaxis family, chemotaxis protein CheY
MHSLQNVDRHMPILVVDEYQSMRRIVRNCLKQLGFENITEAENGSAAVDILNSSEFKLIISDWSMPDATAKELLDQLRSNGVATPVLVVAAAQERSRIPAFDESEKAEVIIKPFTKEILEQKLEQVLSKEAL